MGFLPNSELVAVSWIRQIPGFDTTMVGTTLPAPEVFAEKGFVTVLVVGGQADVQSGERAPVVQLTGHAVNLNSDKPAWGKSNTLLENIVSYCENSGDFPISLPAQFDPVVVKSVAPLGEIRRLVSANSSMSGSQIWASYTVDVLMVWNRDR